MHPGPDLITAFVEKSLNQPEQTRVLEHLAQCADCREVVALALPEQPVAAAAGSVAPVRSSWLAWPVLRWGALAACVVVVGAAVSLHYQSFKTSRTLLTAPSSDVPIAQSKPPAALPSEAAGNAVRPSYAGASSHGVAARAASSARAPLPNSPGSSAPANNLPITTDQLAERKATPAGSQTAAVGAATPNLANEEPAAESAQIVPGRAKDESEPSPASKAKMSLAGGMPAKQMMASSAWIARAAAVPANVVPRWTLTSDGMLQRSIDSGKTWETILVASPGSFRALTANGFDIWVGGAKGALYHSIDAGQHWMRVQPAVAGESLTTDIIGIEFTDLLHGTLTTADKQTWITADAGNTWQKQ